MYWYTIVIALCLLLLSFLLWKETRRANRSWLPARVVASILAVVCLACLALPLTIKKQQLTTASISILVTEGFNADSVKKFISDNQGAKVFTTDKSIIANNPTYVTDLNELQTITNANQLHVFGYGLDDHDLNSLQEHQISFHPSVVKNAITTIGWTNYLASGERLLLQGSFNNAAGAPAKIVLSAFDTDLDSVTINPGQISDFQLTAIPKHIDKAVYLVSVITGNDTLQKEPVPVEVRTIQPLSILLLASSPDFENKFLKNWLAQNEYRLAVRTSISRGKYDMQYLNVSNTSLNRITSSLLEKTDVVIADVTELASLPASDLANIRSFVETRGMGLIVKADNTQKATPFYLRFFPLTETRDSMQHRIMLNLEDNGNATAPLKIQHPLYIRSVTGTQSLIKDQHMRIVANSQMYGLGKIILTTIPNTFNWQLSGNNNDYTSYWSLLLKNAGKKIPLHQVWNLKPDLPVKNETVHLTLQTGRKEVPQVQTGKDIIYLKQHQHLSYQWEGQYWPVKPGWHSLTNDDSLVNWWYVYNKEEWKSVRAADKISATKRYAALNANKSSKYSLQNTSVYTAIPKIYFFVLFIIFSGLLWFEKNYRNG